MEAARATGIVDGWKGKISCKMKKMKLLLKGEESNVGGADLISNLVAA